MPEPHLALKPWVDAETEQEETILADVVLDHADNLSFNHANQAPQLRKDGGPAPESYLGRSVYLSTGGRSEAVDFSHIRSVFWTDFAHGHRHRHAFAIISATTRGSELIAAS